MDTPTTPPDGRITTLPPAPPAALTRSAATGHLASDVLAYDLRRRTTDARTTYERDTESLVTVKVRTRPRHFAPTGLPGFELSHDRDRLDIALTTPTGTPIAVVNDATVKTATLFTPFGAPTTFGNLPGGNPYPKTWNGYLRHQGTRSTPALTLPLMDAGARVYAPTLGRFLSPDPLPPDPLDPRTYDPFTQSFANPIIYVDADGRAAVLAPALVGFVTGAVVG